MALYDELGNVVSSAYDSALDKASEIKENLKISSPPTSKPTSNGLSYLDGNKETKIISYPKDLSTNPQFNGDKIVFFINVAEDSKAVVNKVYTKGKYQAALLEIPDGDVIKKSGQAGKEIIRAVTEGAKKLDPDGSLGIAQLATATSNVQKRLSVAIALHMPNNVSVNQSVNWEGDEGDSNLLEVISAAIKGYENGGAAEAAASAAKTGMGVMAAKMLKDSGTWQRATRVTPGNTKQEMKFSGVNFRTFGFQYTFVPKNASEAEDILEIIRMFKYHMLPEFKGDNTFLFTYPSEFQIKYFRGSKENTFLDKYLTAVCTGVRVNYTADGQYNTFSNGMPTRINVEMDFAELGFATKEIASIGSFHGV